MNHYSYQVMGKEKVKDLQREGMRSQAFHRSGALKIVPLSSLPKLILALVGILALFVLLVR